MHCGCVACAGAGEAGVPLSSLVRSDVPALFGTKNKIRHILSLGLVCFALHQYYTNTRPALTVTGASRTSRGVLIKVHGAFFIKL